MRKYLGLVLLISAVSFAALVPVPDGDPLLALLSLIQNWKVATPLVIGSGLIIVIVEALKKFVGDSLWTRAAITVLGVAYSFLVSLTNGGSLLDVTVMTFIVSGGAVAIYEAVKPLFGKPA
jgi:hypothetical protein